MQKLDVVITGAGMSGLCMAAALKAAGRQNFVLLEKSAGLGGTWWDNHCLRTRSAPGRSHEALVSKRQWSAWRRCVYGQTLGRKHRHHIAAPARAHLGTWGP